MNYEPRFIGDAEAIAAMMLEGEDAKAVYACWADLTGECENDWLVLFSLGEVMGIC